MFPGIYSGHKGRAQVAQTLLFTLISKGLCRRYRSQASDSSEVSARGLGR